MSDALISALLVGVLLLWWFSRAKVGEPKVSICPGCNDLVEYVPGLPTRCPSCHRILL